MKKILITDPNGVSQDGRRLPQGTTLNYEPRHATWLRTQQAQEVAAPPAPPTRKPPAAPAAKP